MIDDAQLGGIFEQYSPQQTPVHLTVLEGRGGEVDQVCVVWDDGKLMSLEDAFQMGVALIETAELGRRIYTAGSMAGAMRQAKAAAVADR